MAREAPLAYQLYALPPRVEEVTDDDILDRFLAYVQEKGLTLYAAQEEAILEVSTGNNVILATPTGSGKSLVATAKHFAALARKQRSIYTCPIKALVSEKFFALCKEFGPENVGMLTGDASVNRDAPILCVTAEILSNMALAEGAALAVDHVIMDEFHYYSDRDRGVAWQVPLLLLRNASFLLMSATIGPTDFFEKALTDLTGKPTRVVRSTERPVPLDYSYQEIPLHETLLELCKTGLTPAYVVCFTQKGAAEQAQNLMSMDFSTKAEKKAIADEIRGFRFDTPYGKDVSRYVRHGVGIHHAGLLPKYRLLVEKIAQTGLLKIICGTDTLGVGVNIPIRSVVLTKLCKFDGQKTSILSVREFQQIGGRAGRRGFDDRGSVWVQAPEHVIENLRMEQRAAGDKAKMRKLVKRKPPDRGYVHWDRKTFDRLVTGDPEPLVSRFRMTHGMLVELLARKEGGCLAAARLIRSCHEDLATRRAIGRNTLAMYRSLVQAGVIEVVDTVTRDGRPTTRAVVSDTLQRDFSMHHALSLYLVETIPMLDRESPTYALDVLSLSEAILENPEVILQRQLDRLKRDKVAEMKAAGVEYEQRMEELDKLEIPKPNREFTYGTFNEFAARHPWVGDNIRPKSIAREMFEEFLSFHDYVRDYELTRSEGTLLRYLTDVYKTLVQSVPESAKDEVFDDILAYFRAIVQSTDKSLLEEWERLRDPVDPVAAVATPQNKQDLVDDPKAFRIILRNIMFSLVRRLAAKDYTGFVEECASDGEWSATRVDAVMREFLAEAESIRLDAAARAPIATTIVGEDSALWTVDQGLLDDEGPTGWVIRCTFDLAEAREAGRPIARLVGILSSA